MFVERVNITTVFCNVSYNNIVLSLIRLDSRQKMNYAINFTVNLFDYCDNDELPPHYIGIG